MATNVVEGKPRGLVRSGEPLKVNEPAKPMKSWMSQSSSAFDELEDLDDLFDDAADAAFYDQSTLHMKLASKSASVLSTATTSSQEQHVSASAPPPAQSFRKRVLPWEDEQDASRSKSDVVAISAAEFANRTKTMEKLKRPRTTKPDVPRKSPESTPTKIVLSDEQIAVRDLVMKGHSLFFTGAAGTGKSVLLREIISSLYSKYSPVAIAVTASTGLAALNIRGETLHRFSGIGLGNAPAEHLIAAIKKRQECMQRWKQCKVLIIDEISMVDGTLLDKLDKIAKNVRANSGDFGGIQVICTGDFFQLPPVDGNKWHNKNQPKVKFAFESKVWQRMMKVTVVLNKVFRQQGDNRLIQLLNCMRMGKLTPDMCRELSALSREVKYDDGILPTELYPTRREVEDANKKRLESLRGLLHVYNSCDIVHEHVVREMRMQHDDAIKLLDSTLSAKKLLFRHESQVMLIRNMNSELVNGSLGIIVAFLTNKEYNAVAEEHLCTGEPFEVIARRVAERREPVEGFPSAKETLSMMGVRTHDIKPVSTYSNQPLLRDLDTSDPQIYPVVRFAGTSLPELVGPVSYQVDNRERHTIAERWQIPLILAWAMSVHKSQGQTLERVKVNLYRTFEAGQAYVAVSRATSTDTLQIINFNPSKVMASEKVIEFYNSLQEVGNVLKKSSTLRRRVKNTKKIAEQSFMRSESSMQEEDDDVEISSVTYRGGDIRYY